MVVIQTGMPEVGTIVRISTADMCDVGIVDSVSDDCFSIKPTCQAEIGKHFFGPIISRDFFSGEWQAIRNGEKVTVIVEDVSNDL